MKLRGLSTLFTLLLMFAGAALPALAGLQRVGPIDSANGYPVWYQDASGLTFDSGIVQNQSELNGGWCLLLPANLPSGTAPEVFPSNFSEEHFYWSASGDASVGNTRALLVLALEGAFGNGPVAPGDQIVFARLRIRIIPVPFDGTYTVYTPYGTFVFPDQVAGDRLSFTEDIGLVPGNFTLALTGRIGPFLLPSATPGGAEMPPLTAANPTPDTDPAHFGGAFAPTPYPGTGRSYIADPARIGPITGSPLAPFVVNDGTTRDPNIFRIEGPNGFVTETVNFSMSGRLFEGAIAGQVNIERASYARTAAGNKVDVYANATPIAQARIPAGPPPSTIPTQLSYYDAACTPTVDAAGNPGPPFSAPVGAMANQMLASGSHYFGESLPTTLPLEVCVQANAINAAGQTVLSFIPTPLGDQVFITEALFDPSTQTLSVMATSSDQVVAQTLTVDGLGTIDGTTGQLLVNPIVAPPGTVTVLSSARGVNQFQVSTGAVAGGGVIVPIAVNDVATTIEDTPTTIDVLSNDTNAASGVVSISSQPLLGSAVVNADGTVGYVPQLNAFGNDTFTYTVTVGTQTSNAATVTVTITPVNDPPVAVDDSLTAVAGITATLDVLSNDTDPDGAADIVAVANVSAVTPDVGTLGTATATAAGNVVTFDATMDGVYTFTYQAEDAAGDLSNTATVTVTVATAETITIARAEFRTSQARYRVDGTIAPAAGQTMTIDLLDAAGNVLRTDTAVSAAGAWAIDIKNFTLPPGATTVLVTSSNNTSASTALNIR